ncbi:alginate biosynthesis protein AlgK [Pseudomonas yamanorum]|nr:alginate biosynthesis protein AlgK [Pseudomonas yamanorum]
MWERACSRKRCISHVMYQLKDRIREQARSHT